MLHYVVADTTKVRIFKQITTMIKALLMIILLLLIPQRYEFSSKSQLEIGETLSTTGCCWYHKGTNFQANHNIKVLRIMKKRVVADTTKVRIFKQITTRPADFSSLQCCCWYHKGTNFQANHNANVDKPASNVLLLIPQRYEFSSKSQLFRGISFTYCVVADTTKVRIFKQITTKVMVLVKIYLLLLIPQRYEFSSKSQRQRLIATPSAVVFDNAKILILKLITTWGGCIHLWVSLYLIMQRYQF